MSLILDGDIDIVSLDGATQLEQIDKRLKTLILSTEQTIPGSRAFGLPRNFLDEPVNTAKNTFAVELQEKIDIYIPEITISAVDMEYDLRGRTKITVHIERSEGA